ncbi:Uncharacterised protein [Mycobacteroides abscessus subsp. abscessus]|nr:Uncharacterised protein [Mycobacteroides abscessus subsp. abscessus]
MIILQGPHPVIRDRLFDGCLPQLLDAGFEICFQPADHRFNGKGGVQTLFFDRRFKDDAFLCQAVKHLIHLRAGNGRELDDSCGVQRLVR